MKKKEKKKVVSGREVVNLEQLVKKNFNQIVMEGNDLGNVLIMTYSYVLNDYKSFGVAAIGLAKAVASLKVLVRMHGGEIDSFFDHALKEFEEGLTEMSM